MHHKTDAIVIGARPCGLSSVCQLDVVAGEPTSHLQEFFGVVKSDPIGQFGIELRDGLIPVTAEKFKSSPPGVFVFGDINVYPGKLKLILSGFHEAALMAKAAFRICRPDEAVRFENTASSSRIQNLLTAA